MGRPPNCPQAKREAWKFFDVVESVFREPKPLFEIVSTHRERGRTDDGRVRRCGVILILKIKYKDVQMHFFV
jgi:hypothetical protein